LQPSLNEDTAMTETAAALPGSRSRTVIVWILRILMAALFLFASFMKLSGQPRMVEEFELFGIGEWFRYLTGLLELAGGIFILVPPVSVFGAMLLLAVDVGALVAQLSVIHQDWIHTIVIGAILVTLIYLQRERLSGSR
jgi:uncharacterized membrane protein YphA (DoxX/SURF4 family)